MKAALVAALAVLSTAACNKDDTHSGGAHRRLLLLP